MNLSCSAMMLGERPLTDAFALAKESGFDGIDLRGDLIRHHISEIQDLIRQTGLPVPTVYGRITVPLLARTLRERGESLELIRSRLRDAAAISASNLIVVPVFGEARVTVDRGEGVAEIEEALLLMLLSELVSNAESAKVRITLEPLNRGETHLLVSPTTAARLTRCLNTPWVGTMVDTYHLDREGQDAVHEVERNRDQIMLVHLSDRGRTLPGTGGIDFAPMLRALNALGYDGFMGYECAGTFDVNQLRASVQWVRRQIDGEER